MITPSNISEIIELLTSQERLRIVYSNKAFIVLNLHQDQGALLTFTLTNEPAQFEATDNSAILPIDDVVKAIQEAELMAKAAAIFRKRKQATQTTLIN